MSRKTYKLEQIIGMLHEAEVRLSQGATVGEVCRGFGVSGKSYYRWCRGVKSEPSFNRLLRFLSNQSKTIFAAFFIIFQHNGINSMESTFLDSY
ncbi:MAG: transposase [Arenicellales bacterium]|jgi:hypothetical protein|nr:transposase [Pseudomonadales bacterium]MDP7518204.1 transposase [Arenicellales bacterium]